jgi:hypothetical protein
MSHFIRPDILSGLAQDRPLPVTQSFIDTVNQEAGEKSSHELIAAISQGAILAIATLELKLGKLMDVLGVVENAHTPGNVDLAVEEVGIDGGGIQVFDPEDRPWER